ncbi:guanine nucleotide binding protein, alpha subunit [Mycena galopus ATCC 62051]|nr:guanine nucleotide binding protein, alpha subunit [Mycena galopus ATCC 62051]
MWRKLSAPLGWRSPPISPALRSHFISSTTVQSPSAQGLGSGRSKEASRTIDVGLREEQEKFKEASRTIDVGLREEQERSEEASRIIDAGLREEWERKKRAVKILLLGQSESGKSSVLLNFRKVFTPQYFENVRLVRKTAIQLNLISLIKIILVVLQEEWQALETDSAESKHATSLTTEHRRLALSLSPLRAFKTSIRDSTRSGYETRNDSSQVTQVLAECKNEIIALFEDALVRGFLESVGFNHQNDFGFILDDIARIVGLDYVPTFREIVRTRKRTSCSVEEHQFVTEAGLRAGTEFYITEFCGNISLISTWLPYLPDVQAILFLAPLVFWQYLDEDPKVNRVG